MLTAFTLGFAQIQCERCGSKDRVAGAACADCGDKGRHNEVNAAVTRRRQAVRAVRAAIPDLMKTQSETLPYYLAQSSWRPVTAEALEQALIALRTLSIDPLIESAQSSAAASIARLLQIQQDLSALPPRRPFILDLAANTKAAGHLVQMANLYLDAFEAGTPLQAQLLAQEAQRQIDAAVEVHRRAEEADRLSNKLKAATVEEFLMTSLDVVEDLQPGKNFLEVDSELRATLAMRLGRPIAGGQGVGYAISEVLAQSNFDVERFRAVVAQASQLCERSPHIKTIASEPQAIEVLREAREALLDSTMNFGAALSSATTDKVRLKRFLSLYRDLFEDAGVALFAWWLRIAGAKSAPIATLVDHGGTALLSAVNQHPQLNSIFVGADKNIRTAASHGFGYSLDGEDIVFNIQSFQGQTMTVEALIDLLLALLESFLAVFWVLDNELASAGVEGHELPPSLITLPMFRLAQESLKHMGAEVESAHDFEGRWHFVLAPGGASEPFIYAAALAVDAPEKVHEIVVEAHDHPQGDFCVPRDALLRFATIKSRPRFDLMRANLDLLSSSLLDGTSALSAEHLRRTAGIAAFALLTENDRGAIGVLRDCLRLARLLGLADVAELSDAALSEWRSPDPPRRRRLDREMVLWAALRAPMQPVVRVTRICRG